MKNTLSRYWRLLADHIRPQRLRFALLTVLLISSIGLQVLNPQVMRSFIDSALSGATNRTLLFTALAFLIIAISRQVMSIMVAFVGENVAWNATNTLRAELGRHALSLDMGFHNEHTPGEMIERIDGDVSEMATFFSTLVVTVIGNVLLLIGILVVLFLEDVRVGLAFTVFSILALMALSRVRDLAVPFQKKRRQAEAELFGFIEEQLSSTEDIRSSGAVDYSIRSLHQLQAKVLDNDQKAQRKNWFINLAMGGSLISGNILAILTGYWLYSRGTITLGTVYMVIYYMNLLEAPIWSLTRQVESFQTIGACVQRLNELRQVKPKVKDGSIDAIPNGPLALSFEGVGFSYNDIDQVIEEITFTLDERKVLGLLGRTGSGKTTLSRLILRLYDPSRGRIVLNGIDLRQAQMRALRKRVGVVTQDVQLFRATIRENLTFFDSSIADDLIVEALEKLELGDWYRALPDGLDTKLEGGGRGLSGGEAQLLAFTRIFLRSPGLVILDEASSRLDPATEQRIERAIDRLLENRTAIIIAHRLETLHRADEVMILDSGRILEHGPRAQLSSDPNSRFGKLLKTGLQEVLA
jgi:ABC-type multidrug transport system fused ATPase/permease subunit